MAFMAHQPKALIYIEFKLKNEVVPPFQHMNECALTWLTEWHGEMLLHHKTWRVIFMAVEDSNKEDSEEEYEEAYEEEIEEAKVDFR
jgi:hypothetical protein